MKEKIIKCGEFTLTETHPMVWEMKKRDNMIVPGKIYADDSIINHLVEDVKVGKEWNVLKQIKNVACLPGIQTASIAQSDVHPGYGFCIGGVGAFDTETGVITVAGVGFDAGCNVANIIIPLTKKDIQKKQRILLNELYKNIPAGLGIKGKISISWDQLDEILANGAKAVVNMGYGKKEDLNFIEKKGSLSNANPEYVSDTAKKRESKQLGTLGSGNHYLEVQYVDEIFDENAAKAYNLKKDLIIISIHCGSRALGHQVGTDYLKVLEAASKKYNIPIRERELVAAPFRSKEGQRYFDAVSAAINYSYANKQVLIHLARQTITKIFGIDYDELKLLYEISHNSVMVEKHKVDGKMKELIVHRKGSTRAFGPGNEELPKEYRKIGQPVLVGGTMGTCSYILHGTDTAMKETFGSACHGAGRALSRHEAKRTFRAEDLIKDLEKKNILIKGHGFGGIAEEAPGAYKDVNKVVDVMHISGIAKKVARTKPLICIKG